MDKPKVLKVKGKIIEKIDFSNFRVYVPEFEIELQIQASGNTLMNYFKELVVGSEFIFEVNANDKTKGRFARRPLDFFYYEIERKKRE